MALRNLEEVRAEVGSVRDILIRHGYNPRRPICPNPQHDDRKPGSVSILRETAKGPERIYCHSCGLNEDAIGLARLLGEYVRFTEYEPGEKPSRRIIWRHPIKSWEQIATRTRLRNELESKVSEKDIILAKTLARLGSKQAIQSEVLKDWDYLSENFNLPLAHRMALVILDRGPELIGLPHDLKFDADWVDRAVEALVA